MSQLKYNPKELLSILVDLDKTLKSVVDENCPDRYLNVSGTSDNDLEHFLIESNLLDDDIGYLASHMALLQLRRELDKTIEIVVETNDLQAHYDFNTKKGYSLKTKGPNKSNINFRYLFLGILIGFVVVLSIFLTLN